jgi:DNA-binding response OmpR family regulator
MSHKIFILEDNELFGETLVDFLEDESFEVYWVKDGLEAEKVCYENNFDLMLFDINVPNLSGLSLLESVRSSANTTPVIFLTSFKDKEMMLKGFDSGCDDFLKKPIDLDELLYRIKAILSRTSPQNKTFQLSSLTYDYTNKTLDSKELTLKQYKLLELLIENKDNLTTKEMIYERLWEWNKTPSDGSLRVYINELKKILGSDTIKNYKGLGYKLEI